MPLVDRVRRFEAVPAGDLLNLVSIQEGHRIKRVALANYMIAGITHRAGTVIAGRCVNTMGRAGRKQAGQENKYQVTNGFRP